DRAFDQLQIEGPPASVADQVQAALTAVPDSTPSGYELPPTDHSAARVIVRSNGEAIRVYVHPQTLAVLHTIPEDQRIMRILFKLHGELMMGDRGSNLVELAASWTIILVLTGLFLWWPRNVRGLGGIVYPRPWNGSRIFWRDLHSVTGVWISALVLFLLLSGLPWAKFWGSYFKTIRRATGTAVAQQDWTTGSERPKRAQGGSGEHSHHGGGSRSKDASRSNRKPVDLAGFDRVVATVRPLSLAAPVVVAPPSRGSEFWSAKSNAANRPKRVSLEVDGKTGEIASREDFKDRHWVDQVVGTCVAAHEGQLFGWPNQLLGLMTALGLVLLCVSGVVMWWRRRDPGVLGAPRPGPNARVSLALLAVVLLLGISFPLFGGSLLVVLLVEKTVLRRIPSVCRWLGLGQPAQV
ncbi:MAG TPA: PepSY domain-containing protein, partial [Planctomycetaceae bacterium]|nr:PepSY domain-containing protein [Planctomycetaceae bacterium]